MAENKKVKKEKKQKGEYTEGKFCPKCASRMAIHSDRFSCGKCGYTEFKNSNPK